MNIFVTLDRNYPQPLKVMLGAMFLNNPPETFSIYLAADGIAKDDLIGLDTLCPEGGVEYQFLTIPAEWFENAPSNRFPFAHQRARMKAIHRLLTMIVSLAWLYGTAATLIMGTELIAALRR